MKWNKPTLSALNTQIDLLGGTAAVSRLLFKSRMTVHRWRKGERHIDFANWEHLVHQEPCVKSKGDYDKVLKGRA